MEEGRKPEYPEKTPGDELQKITESTDQWRPTGNSIQRNP